MLPVLAAVISTARGRFAVWLGPHAPEMPPLGGGRVARSGAGAAAVGTARAARGTLPPESRGARPARHASARRSSTTCSRRRRWSPSAGEKACCGSSRSTTPPRASHVRVQTSSSRFALERLGLGGHHGDPVARGAGRRHRRPRGAGARKHLVAARGGETVFRGALFRSAYELFYTPIPPAEKRAAKSLIDVGFDRLGDAMGGGVISWCCPAGAGQPVRRDPVAGHRLLVRRAVVASRLNRGYMQTLERSLLNRALELDLSDVEDLTTRTVMLRTLRSRTARRASQKLSGQSRRSRLGGCRRAAIPRWPTSWRCARAIAERISRRASPREGCPRRSCRTSFRCWPGIRSPTMPSSRFARWPKNGRRAHRRAARSESGVCRWRRLARVFSVCVSQRAADGLILGLDDQRFEVRFQCGRSLAAIAPRTRDPDRREHDLRRRAPRGGRRAPVWESHRLLDRLDEPEQASFVDEFVKDRANQRLAHVFTLLSLVLPAEPLQIAYRGLHTDDENLRGTALDTSRACCRRDSRASVAVPRGSPARQPRVRERDEILGDLLRSHPSIR